MVPDHVSGLHQFTNNVGALLDVTADQKKCGMNIMPGQDFQQTQSMRIVGAVIVSERQLFLAALQPGERPSEQLPGWRHGLVAHGGSGGDCGGGGEVAVHSARDCKWEEAGDLRLQI